MLISALGFCKIRGRRILLTADDFTLRAGHADGALMLKTMYMEQLCVELKLPMIKLVDGASGGGSVSTAIRCSIGVVTADIMEITTYRDQKGSYLPDLMLLKWIVSLLQPSTWFMLLNCVVPRTGSRHTSVRSCPRTSKFSVASLDEADMEAGCRFGSCASRCEPLQCHSCRHWQPLQCRSEDC
jgi:hypothetical protein